MSSTRRSRNAQQIPTDSESEHDTEPDTPKPQRSHLKKRLSEAYIPDNDASFDDGRQLQTRKSVNINDDAAEKRRRRKSTKIHVIENALAGPSTENNDAAETSKTAAARQKQLTSVIDPPEINVPLDVMNSNFEEWMKMATDNVS